MKVFVINIYMYVFLFIYIVQFENKKNIFPKRREIFQIRKASSIFFVYLNKVIVVVMVIFDDL